MRRAALLELNDSCSIVNGLASSEMWPVLIIVPLSKLRMNHGERERERGNLSFARQCEYLYELFHVHLIFYRNIRDQLDVRDFYNEIAIILELPATKISQRYHVKFAGSSR